MSDYWEENRKQREQANVERRRRKEYAQQNPEHEGMIIPFNINHEQNPGLGEGNYILIKGDTWAVRHVHTPKDAPGKQLQVSQSWLDLDGEVQLFETKAEALQAVHKHRLDHGDYRGGVYEQRNSAPTGWEVIVPRQERLEIDSTLPFSTGEEEWYRGL
jgi:hypothetical protein